MLDQPVAGTAVLDDLPVALHGPKAPAQGGARIPGLHVKFGCDLLAGQGAALFFQQFQNLFTRRYRDVVMFFCFIVSCFQGNPFR